MENLSFCIILVMVDFLFLYCECGDFFCKRIRLILLCVEGVLCVLMRYFAMLYHNCRVIERFIDNIHMGLGNFIWVPKRNEKSIMIMRTWDLPTHVSSHHQENLEYVLRIIFKIPCKVKYVLFTHPCSTIWFYFARTKCWMSIICIMSFWCFSIDSCL